MKKQLTIRRTILAMAIAGLAASGPALGVGTFEQPQPLNLGGGGSITVTGEINPGTDVDFYSFVTQKDDKISIDIDFTYNPNDPASNPEHNIIVYLFDGLGNRLVLDDSTEVDGGSFQLPGYPFGPYTLDPSITDLGVTAENAGSWKIAVTSNPRNVEISGLTSGTGDSVGPYTLTVLLKRVAPPAPPVPPAPTLPPAPPAPTPVLIDIKPGSDHVAVLNPKAKGVVPVALLAGQDFNPFDAYDNVESLRFGRTGTEASLIRCLKEGKDVNNDGKLDRICHFDNEKAGFVKTSTTAKVKGSLKGGKQFEGTGDLKVVPQKPKN